MTSTLVEARRRAVGQWPWVVPFLLAAFIYATQGRFVERGVAGLLALAVVALASRRPDRSLLVLIAGLPFQNIVLAQLYAWGAPVQVVRPLASWKELLGASVVLAGIRGYRAGGRRLDRLDHLGLAYVAIVAAYTVVPRLFAPDAPMALDVRSLGFRASAGFVLLLLGTRHAPLPDDFVDRATRTVLYVGGIVAAVALYEYFFSDSWNRFVIERVRFTQYQIDVLHTRPLETFDIRRYTEIAGHRIIRAGSVFFDPLPAGFFCVLPLAVAVERRVRSGIRSGASTMFLVLTGAGVVLSQTRAALIAALIVVFLAVRPAAGRTARKRIQFAFILVAVLIVAVPVTASSGLSARVTSTSTKEDQSSTDHLRSFWDGVHSIGGAPLGHGLGTSAGVGQRFNDAGSTVTENGYLQVGVETGVLAMIVFGALTIALLRRLNLAARSVPDAGVSAVRGAAIGLAVGAIFLHTWNDFAVAWTLWGLAGASVGVGVGVGVTELERT
jgi:hypothetical protein